MKFVFFGSPEFAAIILEKLINAGFIPEAIVCNPDKPIGRKKIITPPPTKQRILNLESGIKNKIKIFQPEKLDNYSITQLLNYNADFFIVAAYAKIIPKEILEIPRLGTIGVHPSLLPKYRGSSPIQGVILNGEVETGTTLFFIDEKMDHGPILTQRKLENYESRTENYESLMRRLAELSMGLLIETLPDIENKIKNATPQDETEVTYTKKIKIEDAYIEPKILAAAMQDGEPHPDRLEKAIEIHRKIRALNSEPGIWTIQNGKRMKILEAELLNDGKLRLKKIQFESRNPVLL